MKTISADDSADDDDFDSSDSEEDEMERWKREANRPKLPIPKLDMKRRPPLPLILFKDSGVRSELFKTITGVTLPTIINNLSPPPTCCCRQKIR